MIEVLKFHENTLQFCSLGGWLARIPRYEFSLIELGRRAGFLVTMKPQSDPWVLVRGCKSSLLTLPVSLLKLIADNTNSQPVRATKRGLHGADTRTEEWDPHSPVPPVHMVPVSIPGRHHKSQGLMCEPSCPTTQGLPGKPGLLLPMLVYLQPSSQRKLRITFACPIGELLLVGNAHFRQSFIH